MHNQNVFRKGMSTPWGAIQHYDVLAEGVISVGTAGHGGIWLSDERISQLPDHYEPFTGDKRWAEEDEDGALVLQYLGMLSLISEPLTLHVTQEDIDKGRNSRREKRYGGAIVEAYKRQTGDDCGEMICSYHLSPRPGGFRLAIMCDEAKAYIERFDAGEDVQPATFVLEPYVVFERVKFDIHTNDGKVHVDKVSGKTAKQILAGDKEALDFYVRVYVSDRVMKVTHEDKVIFERGKVYNCFFSRKGNDISEVMSGRVRVDDEDKILQAWNPEGSCFDASTYTVDILR